MADQETKRDSSVRVEIIVVLIGQAGVVATALITNWNNTFPKRPYPATSSTTASTTSGAASSPKKSERLVHSNGRLVIRDTFSYDLNDGVEIDTGADFGTERTRADFQWEIVDKVRRSLRLLMAPHLSLCATETSSPFAGLRWSIFLTRRRKSVPTTTTPIKSRAERWWPIRPTKAAWASSSSTSTARTSLSAGALTIEAS